VTCAFHVLKPIFPKLPHIKTVTKGTHRFNLWRRSLLEKGCQPSYLIEVWMQETVRELADAVTAGSLAPAYTDHANKTTEFEVALPLIKRAKNE
jgi:hypothetical protein